MGSFIAYIVYVCWEVLSDVNLPQNDVLHPCLIQYSQALLRCSKVSYAFISSWALTAAKPVHVLGIIMLIKMN